MLFFASTEKSLFTRLPTAKAYPQLLLNFLQTQCFGKERDKQIEKEVMQKKEMDEERVVLQEH